jgi:hypothetical protein
MLRHILPTNTVSQSSTPSGFPTFLTAATDGTNKTKGTPVSSDVDDGIVQETSGVLILAVRSKGPRNPLNYTGWTGILFILLTGKKGRISLNGMPILV